MFKPVIIKNVLQSIRLLADGMWIEWGLGDSWIADNEDGRLSVVYEELRCWDPG